MEDRLPDVLKGLAKTTHEDVIRDCLAFVRSIYIKRGNKPVLETTIIRHLSAVLPAYSVRQTIDVMVQGSLLKKVEETLAGKALPGGWTAYVPHLAAEEAKDLFEDN